MPVWADVSVRFGRSSSWVTPGVYIDLLANPFNLALSGRDLCLKRGGFLANLLQLWPGQAPGVIQIHRQLAHPLDRLLDLLPEPTNRGLDSHHTSLLVCFKGSPPRA
jgi:hypothetical protein